METRSAAAQVFSVPELLELILLALPNDTTHQEIGSMRTIHTCQTASRTWRSLVAESAPLRERLYLPTPTAARRSAAAWTPKSVFPPARPNPWIPHLLLSQRSWGSAYPFSDPSPLYVSTDDGPSQPRHWTFSLEMSRTQWACLPPAGPWRDMLAADPPFAAFWYTRCFYELGSGRAPFVTHLDYQPGKPKGEQRYCREDSGGITLGMIADAVAGLFERSPRAKFVMVESVRLAEGEGGCVELPREKWFVPGSSGHVESDFQIDRS